MNRLDLIKQILMEFNAVSIKYCILRNYEFLLDNQEEQVASLDTVIAAEDMLKAHEILTRQGFIKRKPQFSLMHQAYFKLVNLKKVSFDIQLGGIYWNDLLYLNESIVNNRIQKSFFYVPSDNDTVIMLIVHSILGKRFFKPKYLQIIYKINFDQEYLFRSLTRIFNQRIAQKIINLITKKKLNTLKIWLLVFYFLIKKPIRLLTMAALSGRWLKQKKLYFAPLISILGPDGSGKTTMVTKIDNYLQSQGRKTFLIYMGKGRNHLLPITKLGNKFKKAEKKKEYLKQDKIFWDNIQKIIYTLVMPLVALDLFLRYYLLISPQRLRNKIVITDRYCSDILLTKHVFFSAKKFLVNLFPKPTISVFLYNSPEVLNSRRPEEKLNELNRQLTLFNKFNYSLRLKTSDPDSDAITVNEFIGNYLLKEWK